MSNDLHKGHRIRMRQRFIKTGNLNSFEEHEILEMLLFYAVPRKDTNELAHKILKTFGDLDTLLASEPESISERAGISINTAVLISLVGQIIRRNDALCQKVIKFLNPQEVKDYFIKLLKDEYTEKFYIICLRKNKSLIKLLKLAEGDESKVMLNVHETLSDVKRFGSVYAICAHNHPNGSPDFSNDDIIATHRLSLALEGYGIKLMDHILIYGDKAVSMAEVQKYTF